MKITATNPALNNNLNLLQSATLTNNTLSPLLNTEDRAKTVNAILLDMAFMGTTSLTPQQLSTLQSIATLCPFEDGMAVYQARMLLQPYDSSYYINFCETYVDNNMRISTPSDEEENPLPQFGEVQFSVFPNPTAGEVNVAYKLVDNKSHAQVMLYNCIGEVVYSHTIAGITGNVRISTQHFASGVYLLRIEGYEGLLYSEKLVVLK